jgi:hypothetical protein
VMPRMERVRGLLAKIRTEGTWRSTCTNSRGPDDLRDQLAYF